MEFRHLTQLISRECTDGVYSKVQLLCFFVHCKIDKDEVKNKPDLIYFRFTQRK